MKNSDFLGIFNKKLLIWINERTNLKIYDELQLLKKVDCKCVLADHSRILIIAKLFWDNLFNFLLSARLFKKLLFKSYKILNVYFSKQAAINHECWMVVDK